MMEEFLVVPVSGNPYVLQLEDHDDLLDQAYQIIGCRGVECVHCGPFYMLVDDVGALDPPKPVNLLASTLYPGSDYGDFIHGDVLIGALGFWNSEPDIVGLDPKQFRILLHWFEVVLATGNVPDKK